MAMKGCIHSVCDRSARCCTWRSQRRCSAAHVVQKTRHTTAIAAFASEFDDIRAAYESPGAQLDNNPMRKILEDFGLDVSMLFRDAHKYDMQQLEAGWDEEAGMYDWEKPVESNELCDPAAVCHSTSSADHIEFVFDGRDEEDPCVGWRDGTFQEKRREAQAKADLEARQKHQMEQEMAFELHHSQMARSVNPYATTLYYARFLQDMSEIDETGETSDIPGWIRATFVMETSFDEWNEQLRELLKQQQEKLASNFQGRKLQEYRDSVSELQGDFDYSQLTFPTAEGMYVEEEKEDLSGIGDNLDGLLDVLPGKDAAAEIEAQSYADEIMLQDDSMVNEGDAKQRDGGAGDGGAVEELQFDDILEDDEENVIDF